MSDDPNETIVRAYQDRITRGCYDGIYGLDEADVERVMECQADACAQAFVELFAVPDDMDLDRFLDHMRMGGSSKVGIRRDGNVILWEEFHGGRCVCPLVSRGVVPLQPQLCGCAVHWLRKLFERRVTGPVHVELLDSAATGSENCVFRVTIEDPSPPPSSD